MDKIDQALWEQELREHRDRDADARDESTEFAEFADFTTLAELNRDADSGERAESRELREPAAGSSEPDVLTEPVELKDLETLVGLEELDHLDDTPRAEPPFVVHPAYFAVSVVLMSLVLLAVGTVGYSLGYFVV